MTDSERQQILKMIADGKISAEQGLTLMQALDTAPDDEAELEQPALVEPTDQPLSVEEDQTSSWARQTSEHKTDPEFDRKINRFRSLWMIPMVIGVLITVTGAYWMYSALQVSGMGFWFFMAWLPFLFGVALTAGAVSSRTSRWIYVNIRQKPGQRPHRIVIAFPISLVTWIVNLAKSSMPERERGAAGEVMRAIQESINSNEPLMVDVDDEDGEHVQVYIG